MEEEGRGPVEHMLGELEVPREGIAGLESDKRRSGPTAVLFKKYFQRRTKVSRNRGGHRLELNSKTHTVGKLEKDQGGQ